MLAALARQLDLADEADGIARQLDLDAGVQNLMHRAGHDRALLDLLHGAGEGILAELLDAEADALLGHVDVEHLDLDGIALLVALDRLLAGQLPVEVGKVDHAVDAAGQADEQAELGDVLDIALDLGTGRVAFDEVVPGVRAALLQAQADAALLLVGVEHHDLDLLAGRDDLARVHVLLGPAHLRDVHQALDARLELDEGAVIGDVGDPSGEFRSQGIFAAHTLPGIGLELLHAQADTLGLRIEPDHLDVDLLADGERLGRVVDPLPGDVGDVEQAVDAAQVDEGAVVGDVLDHALQDLTLLQARDQLGALLGPGLLEHRAARDHDVAARAVHLEDLERLRRAHERAYVAHRADIDLTAGQERDRAGEVDGEAALDPAEDDAGHPAAILERLLELDPGFLASGLLARQNGLAVLVLHAVEIDLDLVADLDFRRLAGLGEFLQGNAALGLQSDVDERGVALDGDDDALEDGALQTLDLAERFIEQGGEALLFRFRDRFRFRGGAAWFGHSQVPSNSKFDRAGR